MLGIGIELVTLVAVCGLAGDGVVVRLIRGDDAAELAEGGILEKTVVVARIINRSRHQDAGRAPVIVQAGLEAEILDYAVDNALLALAGTRQLLPWWPMSCARWPSENYLGHFGLLFGKPCIYRSSRCEALGHFARLVF